MTLCSIHPWQFGMLNLTEDGGNRVIKYTDQIYQGVSVRRRLALDVVSRADTIHSCQRRLLRTTVRLRSNCALSNNSMLTSTTCLGFTVYPNQTAVWNVFV